MDKLAFRLLHVLAIGFVSLDPLHLATVEADDIYWVGYQGCAAFESPDPASFFNGDNWLNFLPPCCRAECDPDCRAGCVADCPDRAIFGSGYDPGCDQDFAQCGYPHTIAFGNWCSAAPTGCPNGISVPGGDAIFDRLEIQDESWTFDFANSALSCTPPGSPDFRGSITVNFAVIGSQISNPDFRPAVVFSGDADLTLTNGTLHISPGEWSGLVLGEGLGSQGLLRVVGPEASVDSSDRDIALGNGGGNGRLEVLDGGTVIGRGIYNGFYNGPSNELPSGSVLIDGGGSLVRGLGGINNGTITVSAGGLLSSAASDGSSTFCFLGVSDNSLGQAMIRDPGSVWNGIDRLTIGGVYHTDTTGHGILSIQRGGFVSSIWGVIGNRSLSKGEVTVRDAGSRWVMTGPLLAGDDGKGTLLVDRGGSVSCDFAAIGNTSNGDGAVTVSGARSSLAVFSALRVGFQGQGTINVTGGAGVSDDNCVIGELLGSEGNANVSGRGSHWENTSNLTVGGEGIGVLSVSKGGHVSVGTTLEITPNGTVTVASAGTITVGDCSGLLKKRSNAIFVCPGGTFIADGAVNARVVYLTPR